MGREYSDDDIRNILTQADEYLTEKIPERAQYLQSAAQWQQDTLNTHPWISNEVDSDIAEERRGVFSEIKSQYANLLNSLPNGDFIAATLVRGVEAIKADQAGQDGQTESQEGSQSTSADNGRFQPAGTNSSNSEDCTEAKDFGA